MIPKIHKDFKLNDLSFTEAESLLLYVKDKHPDHYVFLQYWFDSSETITASTSGSTGKPKKIGLEKFRMIVSAEMTADFFQLGKTTKALLCLSSEYIAGKMMWVRALHLGWHLDVVPVNSKPLLHRKNVTYDFAAMVVMQVQNSIKQLDSINLLLIGGSAVPENLYIDLQNLSTNIYQSYAMTETITHVAVRQIASKNTSTEVNSFYKAMPNVMLSIDKRNCLVIKSKKLLNKPVVTNDVVRLINNKEFEWLGRYDHVINSAGVKLFPELIEKKLAPFIAKPFFIAGIADTVLGEKTSLFIESDSEIKNMDTVFEKADFTKYETPKLVFNIPRFVRVNSKINRGETIKIRGKSYYSH
jgi:O-succinylbenzoic acid--CoA ligase